MGPMAAQDLLHLLESVLDLYENERFSPVYLCVLGTKWDGKMSAEVHQRNSSGTRLKIWKSLRSSLLNTFVSRLPVRAHALRASTYASSDTRVRGLTNLCPSGMSDNPAQSAG